MFKRLFQVVFSSAGLLFAVLLAGSMLVIALRTKIEGSIANVFKRLFDIVFSVLGLLVLSPLLIPVAIAVKVTSEGPIFYGARRIGRNGEPITVYKFRSMVVNADKMGGGVTTKGDARITPIGRFIRRYKIDELPQLWNVLTGTMSFVGPRPEDPRYVELYTPEQRKVLRVRPGITSPASLTYSNEEELLSGEDWETVYINKVLPEKLAIDLEYVNNPTLVRDLQLIIRTLVRIVS